MIYKTPSSVPAHVRVTFELPSGLWTDQIYLVGTFNAWNQRATPFLRQSDGSWRVVLELAVDERYAFRYLIDDHWHTDFYADASTTLDDRQHSVVDTHIGG